MKTPAGAFPPASGVRYPLNPVATGDALVEMPTGSGIYILRGLHVENIGYQITVTNGTDVLSASNLCNYNVACTNGITMPTGGTNLNYTVDCGTNTGFFDEGGPLFAYTDNAASSNVVTICPDDPANQQVKVEFTLFDVGTGDQLIAYDGQKSGRGNIRH
ncbi:MAG: hypothetical protein HC912_11590, partial [Saprospiraceae bacterium]|nr:hypothetical protein [Saprospiraceae bacterium]